MKPVKYIPNSTEMQDLSALVLLGAGTEESKNTFLDIGCRHAKKGNNSLLLEENGWSGICVDIEDFSQVYKEKRKSPFYKVDATGDEFINILKEHFPTKFIHYISLDTDEASLAILENILKNNFVFAFMTFEHDYHYVLSDERGSYSKDYKGWRGVSCDSREKEKIESCKFKSKHLLERSGYKTLFENVCIHAKDTGNWLHAMEDWWVNPSYFNNFYTNYLESIASKNIHFEDCFKRITLSREVSYEVQEIQGGIQ